MHFQFSGGVLNNLDEGVFQALDGGQNQSLPAFGNGRSTINNQGVFRKSGTMMTELYVPSGSTGGLTLNNSGTVAVVGGRLDVGYVGPDYPVSITGTSSGGFDIAAGAVLVLDPTAAAPYVFASGTHITGPGRSNSRAVPPWPAPPRRNDYALWRDE